MNQLPSVANTESHAIKEFTVLRIRALLDSWLAKILMRNNSPRSFVGSDTSGLHGKRLAGIQQIRVDEIIGTIRRTDDFDKDFRPLVQRARDRWVSARLQLETNGWQPIVVHKVGKCYYVAQGHYRVSVARSVGMRLIEAVVWDHSRCRTPRGTCVPKQKALRRRTETFSTN
jgi:hypothetical protein